MATFASLFVWDVPWQDIWNMIMSYCRVKMAADVVCAIIQLQEMVLGTKREWRLFCISLFLLANYFRLVMTSAEFIESLNWINIIQFPKLFLISPLYCFNIPMFRRLAPALSLIFYSDFISVRDRVGASVTLKLCPTWNCIMDPKNFHHMPEWRTGWPAGITCVGL